MVKYCQLFHCLSHVDVATLSVIDNKKMQQHPDRLTQLSQQIHAVCTRVTGREAATKRKERLLEVLEQNAAAAADDEDHFRSVMVVIRERQQQLKEKLREALPQDHDEAAAAAAPTHNKKKKKNKKTKMWSNCRDDNANPHHSPSPHWLVAAAHLDDHTRWMMQVVEQRLQQRHRQEKGKNVELCYTAMPPPSPLLHFFYDSCQRGGMWSE